MPHERLAILVPDGAYPEVLGALLDERRQRWGIRKVAVDVIKDTLRDSSPDAAQFIRPFLRQCSHALIVRDLQGSGAEGIGVQALESALEDQLVTNGWQADRCAAVVVEPEIEIWLRFSSTHM